MVVKLEHGRGYLRRDRTEKGPFDDFRLVLPADDQQYAVRLHDRTDSHGIGKAGNILLTLEKAFVRFDGAFGKRDTVRQTLPQAR